MLKEHHHYSVIRAFLEVATLVGQIQDVPVMRGSRKEEVTELGLTAFVDKFLDQITSMQEKCLRVAVVGSVSRGKSTLINAILGEHRLPDDMEACTGVITEVIYGTNLDKVTLVENDQHRVISHTEFLNTVRFTPEEDHSIKTGKAFKMPKRLEQIDHAVLEASYQLGRNGLCLIDTLGFRAGRKAEEITKRFLAKTDVLMFVTRAHPLFEEADEAFLTAQLRGNESRLEHIFFVINDFSGLDRAERAEVLQNARLRLKNYFLTPDGRFDEALFERRVFIVDARTALRSQLNEEKDASLEATGLPALKRGIQQIIDSEEYHAIRLEAAIVQALIPTLNEARRGIAKKKYLLASKGVNTAQVASESARLEGIEARLSELFDQISSEVYGRVLTAKEREQMGVDATPQLSREKMAEIRKKEMAEIRKKVVASYLNRGTIKMDNEDYKGARVEFDKAFEIDPENRKVDHLRSGVMEMAAGNYQAAVTRFREARAVDLEDAKIHTYIAIAHLRLNDFQNASALARQALTLDPDSKLAKKVLDTVKESLRKKAAQEARNRGSGSKPTEDKDKTYFKEGKKFLERLEYPKAVDAFKQALLTEKKPEVYLCLSAAYFGLNMLDEAKTAAIQALKLARNVGKVQFVLLRARQDVAFIIRHGRTAGSTIMVDQSVWHDELRDFKRALGSKNADAKRLYGDAFSSYFLWSGDLEDMENAAEKAIAKGQTGSWRAYVSEAKRISLADALTTSTREPSPQPSGKDSTEHWSETALIIWILISAPISLVRFVMIFFEWSEWHWWDWIHAVPSGFLLILLLIGFAEQK